MNKYLAAMCSLALAVQGCATASKDISATYVSPLQYQAYDCDQIQAEIQRIQARVAQLGGRLDEAASNDKGIMTVGLIIFWPALFALGGTKQQEAEYARLRGEYDALEQQANMKKCRPVEAAVKPAVATTAALVSAPEPAPVTSTPLVPVSTADQAPLDRESKYMFSAERFAKGNGCVTPVARMTVRTPASETFTITCASAEAMIVRCDGACRELK